MWSGFFSNLPPDREKEKQKTACAGEHYSPQNNTLAGQQQ
jgi:hypothetical protein